MKFHIVENGERVKDILFLYSLNIDELKECNRQIKFWDKLIPGTKIKIPVIPESVDNDIMEMEPFIEDYYPVNNETFDENEDTIDDLDENNIDEEKTEIISENNNDENTNKQQQEIEKKDEIKDDMEDVIKYYKYYHPYYGYIMVPYVYGKRVKI